ncbi:MAG: hypothetical protein J4F49_07805 [Rhodobacteraceae bacterium]|nr:hypothetical protein [Paracoccaceae bacterium]
MAFLQRLDRISVLLDCAALETRQLHYRPGLLSDFISKESARIGGIRSAAFGRSEQLSVLSIFPGGLHLGRQDEAGHSGLETNDQTGVACRRPEQKQKSIRAVFDISSVPGLVVVAFLPRVGRCRAAYSMLSGIWATLPHEERRSVLER